MYIGLHVKYGPSRLWFESIFNVFINDIAEYLDTEEAHTPVINSLRTPGFIYLQMIFL
jgi:hypothetical protein